MKALSTKLLLCGSSVLLVCCLTACKSEPEMVTKSGNQPLVLTQSPGKTAAPVNIHFNPPSRKQVGETVAVPFTVTPTAPVDEMVIHVRPSGDKLVLQMPQTRFVKQAGAQAVPAFNNKLVAVPTAEGLGYITIIVETRRGNRHMSRVVMVPVRVGDAPLNLKPEGELIKDADGDAIISLPAEQSGD
ncbi:MAG TPA: hypothetical protein VFP95_03100 [Gammaproteobacteria bacterium]|nr:hypothetical protein [Gammaproteobacteria bacterium]